MPEVRATSCSPVRRLHVVIVDEELPYPPRSGKRIRILNLVRHLAARHDITLICHANADPAEIPPARQHLQSLGVRTIVVPRAGAARLAAAHGLLQPLKIGLNLFSAVPYSVQWNRCPRLKRAVDDYARRHSVDVWQCEWAPYATNFLDGRQRPWIMMAHDIQTSIWQRHLEAEPNRAKQVYIRSQWNRYRNYETAVFRSADMTLAVTEQNAAIARDAFGAQTTEVVENGVDVAYYQSDEFAGKAIDPAQIVFVGNLQWRPNLDAARQLLDEIFPQVVAAEPSARLAIVGRCPPAWLRQRCAEVPGAELHADVPDVRPFLHRAGVMAVPLRFASGSRLKILEALACALPVVSSSVGAEGLQLAPGEHYTRADSPGEMAAALVDAIRRPEAARSVAAAGRQIVQNRYDWSMLARDMENAWLAVAKTTPTEDNIEPITSS
jgi:glycosyltransferase involved in cell wall biosynthesis